MLHRAARDYYLGAVRLMRMVGIDLVHVPFKGSGPATSSVITGETSVAFSTMPSAVPQAKEAAVLLAVSFPKALAASRSAHDRGDGGRFRPGLVFGLVGARRTPRDIVAKLHSEIVRALDQPKVKEILAVNSAEPGRMKTAQFGEYVAKEVRTGMTSCARPA